jgi:hypothetical protein
MLCWLNEVRYSKSLAHYLVTSIGLGKLIICIAHDPGPNVFGGWSLRYGNEWMSYKQWKGKWKQHRKEQHAVLNGEGSHLSLAYPLLDVAEEGLNCYLLLTREIQGLSPSSHRRTTQLSEHWASLWFATFSIHLPRTYSSVLSPLWGHEPLFVLLGTFAQCEVTCCACTPLHGQHQFLACWGLILSFPKPRALLSLKAEWDSGKCRWTE